MDDADKSRDRETLPDATGRALELEAEERRWARAERLACIVALLAGSIAAHLAGAPDALVYNLSGGALTLLLPSGTPGGLRNRLPLALLAGSAATFAGDLPW